MSQFDAETRLERLQENRFSGHIHRAWNIGDNPNGGYLAALALQALRDSLPEHPDPLSITVHYLRPGTADAPCEVQTQIIRQGRTLSTARATLVQQGKARLEVVAAMGRLGNGDATRLTIERPSIPPPDQCPLRSGDEQGVTLPILDRLEVRLHPDEARAGAAGRAQVTGWLRFRDERPADPPACVLFADAMPPAVFGLLGVVGWVPTIELTVHVRRRPTPGWILGQMTTTDLADGRMIEDGALWDEQGHLVARSRQLALVLS